MSTFPVLLNPSLKPGATPRLDCPGISSRSIRWIPAALGVLFVAFTSTTFMGGSHSQAVITAIWGQVLGHWHWNDIGPVNLCLRKTGHFFGHGLLSLVFANFWLSVVARLAPDTPRSWRSAAAILAVLTTMAIASLDELHQMFLPGRVGCARDVLIDVAGALLANYLMLRMANRRATDLAVPAAGQTRCIVA